MRSHLFGPVSKPTQCSVQGILGNRPSQTPHRRKQPASITVDPLQFAVDRERLARKGHTMGATHFLFCYRNAPFTSLKINLGPFRMTKLPGRTKTRGARR